MTDIVNKKRRSAMMSGIKGKDTRPEMLIRHALHAKGFRYKLHDKSLPGKPDMVFPKYRAIIEVHGCFWHKHDCPLFSWPKTREAFWRKKINGNARRDARNLAALQLLGWRVLTVWECSLKGKTASPFCLLVDSIECWLLHSEDNLVIP